jgi:hypothetical protein
MFNFGANHLFLISRTEYASCAVLLMLDHDTLGVCIACSTSPNALTSDQAVPTLWQAK